jgi:hypothetical protein
MNPAQTFDAPFQTWPAWRRWERAPAWSSWQTNAARTAYKQKRYSWRCHPAARSCARRIEGQSTKA